MAHAVYFDRDHEDLDGCGWNVIDDDSDSGIALRFKTEAEALAAAAYWDSVYAAMGPDKSYEQDPPAMPVWAAVRVPGRGVVHYYGPFMTLDAAARWQAQHAPEGASVVVLNEPTPQGVTT